MDFAIGLVNSVCSSLARRAGEVFLRNSRARSIQPKFQPVRPGKEDHLKRWTRFFETFPVGPNRSIEFWTEISGNFGRMDRAPNYRGTVKSVLLIKQFLWLVEMMFGQVYASLSLPEWQAIKMTFFAPCEGRIIAETFSELWVSHTNDTWWQLLWRFIPLLASSSSQELILSPAVSLVFLTCTQLLLNFFLRHLLNRKIFQNHASC